MYSIFVLNHTVHVYSARMRTGFDPVETNLILSNVLELSFYWEFENLWLKNFVLNYSDVF